MINQESEFYCIDLKLRSMVHTNIITVDSFYNNFYHFINITQSLDNMTFLLYMDINESVSQII